MLTENKLRLKKYGKKMRRKKRLAHGEKHLSQYNRVKSSKKWKPVVPKISQPCCRWAPSLGALEGTHQEVWGTLDYNRKEHKKNPTVFFGLYDLRDYIALWRHRGPKWILWAGSDLRNLSQGFAFNDGKLKWLSVLTRGLLIKVVIRWIKRADNYVENQWEADILEAVNVKSTIVPSFMGNVSDYKVSYKHQQRPQVYVSIPEKREVEYGVEYLFMLARRLPQIDFHVYGIDRQNVYGFGDSEGHINLHPHGRVSKELMNNNIKNMHCGLRLNATDGFSEITAKSILWGQYPITRLENPMIPHFENDDELVSLLESLSEMKTYNQKGREYYLKALNNFPWNVKNNK
jgi:hypothetical protein